jgi:hypothetical protein
MSRIIAERSRDCYGFARPQMNKVAMASLTTAIRKASAFKIPDQLADFSRQINLNKILA